MPRFESREQHVGVAHLAQPFATPFQLVTQRLAPVLVDDLAERAEVGAEAPGGDARLVHRLRVVVDAHAWVVVDQLRHRRGDGGRQHFEAGRRDVELAGWHDVGRVERARPDGAHDLGDRIGATGTGLLQELPEHGRDLVVGVLGELDLELAEPCRQPHPVDDRHLVVVDLGEAASRRVADVHRLADRVETGDELHGCAARQRPDEVDALPRVARRPRRARAARCGRGRRCRATGSFTIQPSSLRCRRLAPARASRRSGVSKYEATSLVVMGASVYRPRDGSSRSGSSNDGPGENLSSRSSTARGLRPRRARATASSRSRCCVSTRSEP